MTDQQWLDKYEEKYAHWEEEFNPMNYDRSARRRRKKKPVHEPKKPRDEIIEELTDRMYGLEGGFDPTYQPSEYEAEWLLKSLGEFYAQSLVTDVLRLVKGGKEASVYLCEAHPSTGKRRLAAKVYRPHKFRALTNDAVYRKGRSLLTADGHDIHGGGYEHRVVRAVGKKTAFGRQVSHTSWLMHEYKTLQALHAAGGAVPEPVAVADNAILMGFCGGDFMPAPTLQEVTMSAEEAAPLYEVVLDNVRLMLDEGLVHGDLSAYNILYWEGEVTLIDFPQVVDAHANGDARRIFERDIRRVCEHFSGQGVETGDPDLLAAELWRSHVAGSYRNKLADLSREVEIDDDNQH